MPSFRQLTRQVFIGRNVVREERETVEGRVAAGIEDQDRRQQHQVIDDVSQP